jgi:hypothetical protein
MFGACIGWRPGWGNTVPPRSLLEVILTQLAEVILLSMRLHTRKAEHGHQCKRKDNFTPELLSVLTTKVSSSRDHYVVQLCSSTACQEWLHEASGVGAFLTDLRLRLEVVKSSPRSATLY